MQKLTLHIDDEDWLKLRELAKRIGKQEGRKTTPSVACVAKELMLAMLNNEVYK